MIWALGFVSLFMDFRSEMIQAVQPLLLTTTMHANVSMVGLGAFRGPLVATDLTLTLNGNMRPSSGLSSFQEFSGW